MWMILLSLGFIIWVLVMCKPALDWLKGCHWAIKRRIRRREDQAGYFLLLLLTVAILARLLL